MPDPVRFTAEGLAKLSPGPRRYVVFDPTLPAFGLRIDPTNSKGRVAKTFQLSYRVGRRQRMATLGRLGIVTLEQARREARRMLGVVAAGRDPLEERDARKAALSVREAAAKWLADHVEARRKPSTVRNYRLAVDSHIIPALGSVPVGRLSPAEVVKLHAKLKATPYLANRVVAALSAFCSWCERAGYRTLRSNPCHGLERYHEEGHRRYLDADEYARLGAALRAARANGTVSPGALTAIELMLLTGCRPAEILTLQWAHVHPAAGTLELPDSKTGRKTIYLPPQAVVLFRSWPRFAGSPFVFPATGVDTKSAHMVNVNKPWRTLRIAAQLEDVRLYDACRHSFASVGISTHGHALSVVGELLGHGQAATTKRYAHLHAETAKAAASAIGSTIADALSGERTE